MRSLIITVLSALAVIAPAHASPVGLWKTIDEDTRVEKSLVRISETGGVYTGTIEKLLDPAVKPDAVCDKCRDDRKGKPLVGLVIIRNVKRSVDDANVWDDGDITDPNNGRTYRVRLKPIDDGKRLEVRGYFGPFHRTQHWVRAE